MVDFNFWIEPCEESERPCTQAILLHHRFSKSGPLVSPPNLSPPWWGVTRCVTTRVAAVRETIYNLVLIFNTWFQSSRNISSLLAGRSNKNFYPQFIRTTITMLIIITITITITITMLITITITMLIIITITITITIIILILIIGWKGGHLVQSEGLSFLYLPSCLPYLFLLILSFRLSVSSFSSYLFLCLIFICFYVFSPWPYQQGCTAW